MSRAAFKTVMSSTDGEPAMRVMRFAAYSTPDRLPPRLGSSARRRGRDATRQRWAVTAATPSAATARTAHWTLVERVRDAGVGPHEQEVALVRQEQQHGELQDEQPEDERVDEDAGRSSS